MPTTSSVTEQIALHHSVPAMPAKSAPYWVSVVSHLDPRYGGLSTVVPQLTSLIASTSSFSMGLAAFCNPNELYAPSEQSSIRLTYWPAGRSAWLLDRSIRSQFREEMKAADGLHIHGLWEQSTAIAGHTARGLRIPYVLSAHGMLEPWALSNRKWKKILYSTFFERANIEGAACLHALTRAEAEDYRRFGCTRPIAVIPNGVTIPEAISPEIFLSKFPTLRDKKIILFLGRIHFKKGLDILVESWAELSKRWPEAHLVIAGPDFEGTRAELEGRISELRLSGRITFTGMLRSELKWSAMAAAACFVLPSYSEGLSVSVLEAMGIGLPVVITKQCNLPEVEQLDAGWIIRSNRNDLTSALGEFLANSADTNRSIGSKGCRLVTDRYNWTTVTQQFTEVYQWVLGGSRPTTVDLV